MATTNNACSTPKDADSFPKIRYFALCSIAVFEHMLGLIGYDTAIVQGSDGWHLVTQGLAYLDLDLLRDLDDDLFLRERLRERRWRSLDLDLDRVR